MNNVDTVLRRCSTCKKDKPLSEFPKDKHNKSGYTCNCKECRYKKSRAWHKQNYKENKEVVLEKNKTWRKENWKEVYKQRIESGSQARRRKKWYHNKGKYNLNWVITERLRCRVRRVITKGYKSASTLELLGCSIGQLKLHLESKFTEGMTWENYGKWHIDHIIPCDSFDLQDKEQQKLCFNYTNLQPLWAVDNLHKGAKYNG